MKNQNVPISKGQLLAAVERWTTAHWGRANFARLAAEAGIGLGTAARLKDPEVTIGLDKVHAIAQCFGVEIWEFLDPAIDPKARTAPLSPEVQTLGRELDALPVRSKEQVLRVAWQVIELAKDLAGQAEHSEQPELLRLPAPQNSTSTD